MGDYIQLNRSLYHTTLLNQGQGLRKPDIFVAKITDVPLFGHQLDDIKRNQGVANVPRIVAQRLGDKTLLVLNPFDSQAYLGLTHIYWHVVGISADDYFVYFRLLPNAALTYFWQPEGRMNCYDYLLNRSRKQEDNNAPPYIATLSVSYDGGTRHLEVIPDAKNFLSRLFPINISPGEACFIGQVNKLVDFYYLSHEDNPICEFPAGAAVGQEEDNPNEGPDSVESCIPYNLETYLTQCLTSKTSRQPAIQAEKRQQQEQLLNSYKWRKGAPPLGLGQEMSRLPEMYAAALFSSMNTQKEVN